jgi:hypothetical protein
MAEVLKTTTDLMLAREVAARLDGQLEAFQARPWWRRLVGRASAADCPKGLLHLA